MNRIETFKNPHIRPMWRDAWMSKENALRTRFTRNTERLNTKARDLAPLSPGERVFAQNQNGNHPTKWDRSGIVMESHGNDQYLVKIDGSGRLTLRNRRFLRQYTVASPTIAYPKPVVPFDNDAVVEPSSQEVPSTPQETFPSELTPVPPPVDLPTPDMNSEQPRSPDGEKALGITPRSPIATAPQSQERATTPDPPMPSSHRPRRERKPRKLYDAHSGTWI